MTVEEAKTALIELLKEQVTQLSIMSKIELGDDVIEEYNKLNDIIEAKQHVNSINQINKNKDGKHELLQIRKHVS